MARKMNNETRNPAEIELIKKQLEAMPSMAIEARKNFDALIIRDKMEAVCLAHPRKTSWQEQIYHLEMVGKRMFVIKGYFSERDIHKMIRFSIDSILNGLGKDEEWRAMAVESMESVYEYFEKHCSVFGDKTAIAKRENQNPCGKGRLNELLEAMPMIAVKARKSYSAIDLMCRMRDVCFASAMSIPDKNAVLMKVWERIYWIKNEFTEEDLNDMIHYSVDYLSDIEKESLENIESVYKNFDLYFNKLNKRKS